MDPEEHFSNLEGFEEVLVKNYSGEERDQREYSASFELSDRVSIREANHFRDVHEKFDRIFYQKEFCFIW